MKFKDYERALLETLLIQCGETPEKARADVIVIQFLLTPTRRKSARREEEQTTAVSDAREALQQLRDLQHAGPGVLARLQGLLSLLSEPENIS